MSALTCTLDGSGSDDCGTGDPRTKTYTNLAPGPHTVAVAGTYDTFACINPSDPSTCSPSSIPVDDSWSWTITASAPDTTKPTASLTSPVPWAQLGSASSVKWTAPDGTGSGIKNFTLARKRAPYNGNFGAVAFIPLGSGVTATTASLAAGATDCFAIRATDNANNMGAFSPWRCTTLPLDDRALSRSAGWSLGSSSSYFNSTFTGTSSATRTLAKASAQVKRVGLVAV